MRLVIERGELQRALSHVTSVVERRTTIPILSNVLLNATETELRLKATDLERDVTETVRADVTSPGALTVPAHVLHEIVRKLPDGCQIELKRDGERERLMIAAGQSRFALQALAAGDFPDLSAGDLSHEFTLASSELKRLIDKTRFAISTEETRYYLNGIFLHCASAEGRPVLRAVATDGHRLAQAQLACPQGANGMPGIIIPRKTVHELNRLLEDTSLDIKVGVSPVKVRLEIGPITLVSKLIEGTFPDYARVIPQGNDKVLTVSNAEFTSAVDRVATIASERSRAVKLNLTADKLVLSVNNPDGGSATEEIAVDYRASPLEIGFNARYLLDIAGQLESDSAVFRLADPGSPTIVRDSSDDSALYVLMPMRV
jgi:DNA polymerase-3 subunit beta